MGSGCPPFQPSRGFRSVISCSNSWISFIIVVVDPLYNSITRVLTSCTVLQFTASWSYLKRWGPVPRPPCLSPLNPSLLKVLGSPLCRRVSAFSCSCCPLKWRMPRFSTFRSFSLTCLSLVAEIKIMILCNICCFRVMTLSPLHLVIP